MFLADFLFIVLPAVVENTHGSNGGISFANRLEVPKAL